MRIKEEIPNALFKAFCAIALGLWAGDKKTILCYLLFGMGFSLMALVAVEIVGWVEVIRPSSSSKNEEVTVSAHLRL